MSLLHMVEIKPEIDVCQYLSFNWNITKQLHSYSFTKKPRIAGL